MVNSSCRGVAAAQWRPVNAALSGRPVRLNLTCTGKAMAAPRKIFRIEETATTRLGASEDTPAQKRHSELMQQIVALRAMLAAASAPAAGRTPALPDAGTEHLSSELNLIAEAISGEAPS